MRPITHHPENNPPKKGGMTARTGNDVGSEDYAKGNIEDPLSKNSVLMNKPGSSIPSIFARMLFFDTAFSSIDPKNLKACDGKTPLYNVLVSQCLDLLEHVFNKGEYLEYEVWNKDAQIKALKESNHTALAEALEAHTDTYLAGVENIYLIYGRDKKGNRVLMGGTSPYTLVYTSPNWKSGKPIKSLLDREDKFQEYVFTLQQYLKTLQLDDIYANNLKGFIDYVDKCLSFDPTKKALYASKAANATYDGMMDAYPPIMYKNNSMEIAKFKLKEGVTINIEGQRRGDVSIYLQSKKDTGMHSQFYIKGDNPNVEFDPRLSPLVLPTQNGNQYTHLKYYDEQDWKSSTCELVPKQVNMAEKVPPMPNADSRKLELPDCEAYRHNYLSEVDFLEDQLIEVPYLMDASAFYNVINIPQSDTNAKAKSYFLPIKGVLFKYFTVRTIVEKLLHTEIISNNKVKVSVQIPIQDQDGHPTGAVNYSRDYELPMACVCTYVSRTNPISIGISPFVRLIEKKDESVSVNGIVQHNTIVKDATTNHYDVSLQADNMPDDLNLTLDMLVCGSSKTVDRLNESIESTRIHESQGALLHLAKIYNVKRTFDAIRLRVMHGENEQSFELGAGIVIPKWPVRDIARGEEKYYYSVDFGTTNTHVAYLKISDKDKAYSFKTNEIYKQVQYLAAVPEQCSPSKNPVLEKRRAEFLENIYGPNGMRTLLDQARIFYPNFLLEDKDYGFPIRTVTTKKNGAAITGVSSIFSDISIGFHHSKEFSTNTSKAYGYDTTIKWGLEKNGDAEAQMKARLFFREILSMIRNHWMSNDDSGYNKPNGEPKLVLTFPLAMKNVNAMMDIWAQEYRTVFGKEPQIGEDIERVPESLAPAYRLIAKGASTDQGILNVDIGGGTTDLQYYAKTAGQPIAYYDSVRFAGDDLWGSGYENVPGSHQKEDNVFTRFAKDNLSGLTFDLGGKQESTFDQIDFNGKEKINVLMRDRHKYFIDKLSASEDMAKRVAQLHYAAIIYYIANWFNLNPQLKERTFPAIINFTGFGSKYIKVIFSNDEKDAMITAYTKKLLVEFGIPASQIPSNFQLIFEPNPKDITAEGAVLYVSDKSKVPATLKQTRHMGFEGAKQLSNPKWKELTDNDVLENSVFKFFDNFVDAFQNVTMETGALSADEVERLKERGRASFREMHNLLSPGADKGGTPIGESLFFWMLKGSLFELDREIATV